MNLDLLLKKIFLGVVTTLLLNMALVNLKFGFYGDGDEYGLILCSFYNHLSPDAQEEDVELYKKVYNDSEFDFDEQMKRKYFEAKNGERYSYHFWGYSLICLPFFTVLKWVGAEASKAFILTNVFFVFILLYAILFKTNFKKWWSLAFGVLMFFSGILWYFRWTHPEIMTFCSLYLALIYAERKNYNVSTFWIVLASIQNPSISFVLVLIFFKRLYEEGVYRFKEFIPMIALGALVLLPHLFYYVNYGKISLIADSGFLDASLVDWFRFKSLLFDFNQGIIVITPLLLITCLVLIMKDVYKKTLNWESFLILFFVLCALPTLQQVNWNMGASGVARYGFWLNVFLLYYTFSRLHNLLTPIKEGVLVLCLVSQIVLSVQTKIHNPFVLDSLKFNSFSKWIMDTRPSLYNPEPEIFTERLYQHEGALATHEVFEYRNSDNELRKVLIKKGKEESYLNQNHINEDLVSQREVRDYIYINFDK